MSSRSTSTALLSTSKIGVKLGPNTASLVVFRALPIKTGAVQLAHFQNQMVGILCEIAAAGSQSTPTIPATRKECGSVANALRNRPFAEADWPTDEWSYLAERN